MAAAMHLRPCLFAALAALAGCAALAWSAPPAARARHAWLLVANKGDQTIGFIDPGAGRMVSAVRESGFTVHELAVSPDGRTLFAPVYGSGGVGSPGTNGRAIDVIDIASRRLLRVIPLGRGLRPHCPKFGPGGLLYVSTELDNAITIIDPATGQIVGSIPTGQPESHMFAFSPDGRRAYTANVGPGTVSVLDVPARKLLAVIPVARTIQRMAVSTDGRWAFTSDQRQPRLAVIDTAAQKLDRWIALPGIGYGAAPTPDGRYLLIAIMDKNEVAVLDLATMRIAHVIPVPRSPQEIVVAPDGQRAYVSCSQSRQVAALDLATWKVARLIAAGPGADGLAWAPAR